MGDLLTNSLLEDWGTGEPGGLAAAIAERRRAGLSLYDYVSCNPQEHGFEFDQAFLKEAIAQGVESARLYAPDPRGRDDVREAIVRYHGGIDASQVLLTPGTSLAYYYAFRLLCAAGEEVLCPSPTYPLFEDIARLAGVRVRRYHLRREERGDLVHWAIDPDEVRFQLTSRTKAMVLVSPHNPTGSVATAVELEAVCEIARERGIALIQDEVFREFVEEGIKVPRTRDCDAPLSITLNGFSKMFSLPAMKIGWMAVEGDAKRAHRLLSALEYLSDTFLPVSDYLQAAAVHLLTHANETIPRLASLWQQRRDEWQTALSARGIVCDRPEAGVYVPFRIEGVPASEPLCEDMVRRTGVVFHPGEYYLLPRDYFVTTVTAPPSALALDTFLGEVSRIRGATQ